MLETRNDLILSHSVSYIITYTNEHLVIKTRYFYGMFTIVYVYPSSGYENIKAFLLNPDQKIYT